MAKTITIVTINYNNSQGLKKTLESVAKQSMLPFQYLVIDGASTDGSMDIITQFSDIISDCISEPDNGIYHAMNKGIDLATGDYLLFLNSGDSLADDRVLEAITPYLNADLVYGNLLLSNESFSQLLRFPEQLPFSFFTDGFNSLPHPATFINKSLFKTVGKYNEHHLIVSDWTFFLLALHKYNCTYCHVNMVVSSFNLDGVSSRKENVELIRKERSGVLSNNFPTFIDDYARLRQMEKDMKDWQKHWLGKIYRKINRIFNFH
jgi:glycosyltransferase involved in cell wall biosynthesis